MPSHPKTKCEPDKLSQSKSRGHGGPLKRTGTRAEEWDSVIGPSLDAIPATQLPTAKTVIQRYRAHRIEQPHAPVTTLAKLITTEVKAIWDRARVPTTAEQNCVRKVQQAIELWNWSSPHSSHNSGEQSQERCRALGSLGSLVDLAPKLRGKVTEEANLEHLQSLMRQACDMKRRKSEGDLYDWMVDYGFYLDQYKVQCNYHSARPLDMYLYNVQHHQPLTSNTLSPVNFQGDRVQTLGAGDKKLYQLQNENDELARKRTKYHDDQQGASRDR